MQSFSNNLAENLHERFKSLYLLMNVILSLLFFGSLWKWDENVSATYETYETILEIIERVAQSR